MRVGGRRHRKPSEVRRFTGTGKFCPFFVANARSLTRTVGYAPVVMTPFQRQVVTMGINAARAPLQVLYPTPKLKEVAVHYVHSKGISTRNIYKEQGTSTRGAAARKGNPRFDHNHLKQPSRQQPGYRSRSRKHSI